MVAGRLKSHNITQMFHFIFQNRCHPDFPGSGPGFSGHRKPEHRSSPSRSESSHRKFFQAGNAQTSASPLPCKSSMGSDFSPWKFSMWQQNIQVEWAQFFSTNWAFECGAWTSLSFVFIKFWVHKLDLLSSLFRSGSSSSLCFFTVSLNLGQELQDRA